MRTRLDDAGLRWLYLLVPLPTVTDIIETGRLPVTPREWVTEIAVGIVIAALVYRVRQQHAAALGLARRDALTGLGNRRAFDDVLHDECARARRLRLPLCLVCIDLDHFKLVNDRAGHDAGDRVLRQLAEAIGRVVRAGVDRGFRLGGDEFAVLLPSTRLTQADAVLERIKAQCADCDALWRDGPLGLSAGVVEFDGQESSIDFVIRADAAMYDIKRAHRRAADDGEARTAADVG